MMDKKTLPMLIATLICVLLAAYLAVVLLIYDPSASSWFYQDSAHASAGNLHTSMAAFCFSLLGAGAMILPVGLALESVRAWVKPRLWGGILWVLFLGAFSAMLSAFGFDGGMMGQAIWANSTTDGIKWLLLLLVLALFWATAGSWLFVAFAKHLPKRKAEPATPNAPSDDAAPPQPSAHDTITPKKTQYVPIGNEWGDHIAPLNISPDDLTPIEPAAADETDTILDLTEEDLEYLDDAHDENHAPDSADDKANLNARTHQDDAKVPPNHHQPQNMTAQDFLKQNLPNFADRPKDANDDLNYLAQLADAVSDLTNHASHVEQGNHGVNPANEPVNPASSPEKANHAPIDQPLVIDENRSYAQQVAEHRKSLSPLPSIALLDPSMPQVAILSKEELAQLAERLELKLLDFNIQGKVVDAIQGPVVTSFHVDLAPGVKASKVSGVAQDLARSLAMDSLRVVEWVKDKPYISLEIPNKHRQMVSLIELVQTDDYQDPSAGLSLVMGKDIMGRAVITDLVRAPHMLVAGTTGSGKSVLVNSMLLSMLLKYTPEDLRLILIDPKFLELTNYDDIPHLLTPVVTNMNEAVGVLGWCVEEMERRYQLMKLFKVRKLEEFNQKIDEANARGENLYDPLWNKLNSASTDAPPVLKRLPLIAVVADEFADMIMQLGKAAEEPITRLTQKSRAAGIHLILATQRPSVDVITGLIKANIPTRVGLRVGTRVDSRTILDQGGAEDMLGHGDMLFLAPNSNDPIRVHGAYIKNDEVNRVCDAWRARGYPQYVDMSENIEATAGGGEAPAGGGESDALYDEVVAWVLESKITSVSGIQRRFSIGFNRAGRIMDAMEAAGVLSAPGKSGKRDILLT